MTISKYSHGEVVSKNVSSGDNTRE